MSADSLPDRGESQRVKDLRAADTAEIARLDALEAERDRLANIAGQRGIDVASLTEERDRVQADLDSVNVLHGALVDKHDRLQAENERLREALSQIEYSSRYGTYVNKSLACHEIHDIAERSLETDEQDVTM